ncbi:S8 family peptidase [Anaeromicropila populeti]|uniref:Subtilase family protein n=1 Tax=Anaeromicropila populeti TaxID=37658 RepID=A0A1I6ISM8_9FIRM|nr:S8 family peptidase [Anaeromicropila populeti]SFR69745.1 Subtilase family protein [Anaeromicropila populeti]
MDITNQPLHKEEEGDLIVFYQNRPEFLNRYEGKEIQYINEAFAVVHMPVSQLSMDMVSKYGYAAIPKLYGLTSERDVEASGINRLRNIPSLNMFGNGVLVGIVDTGIDYTNPVFIKADGSTKILSIWDQEMETGVVSDELPFGTEYDAEQINQALASEDSFQSVPSKDENGHGTMMAAVAAGNANIKQDFRGVAPEADLVIVKLRRAKEYLRRFYGVPSKVDCFQENHIMWGIQYCINQAVELRRPIVICIGCGTSQGSHDGRSYLATMMSILGDVPNIILVTSMGNEGISNRHYYNTIQANQEYQLVELQVGEEDKEFTMELWGNAPGIYSVDITSPSGEYIPKTLSYLRESREIKFVFESTIIYVDSLMAESRTGEQLILLRFFQMTPGKWIFKVYSEIDLSSGFHIWLPMGNMISDNTYFSSPDVYTTVLSPGSATIPITITAYNTTDNSLYIKASRGYTKNNIVKPDLAAPGVNYIAPNQNQEFVSYSGTGVAAAHTAGIIALILEWSAVKGNQPYLDSLDIKNYLIRGAKRVPYLSYPNKDWGYGIIDVYNSFDILKMDFLEG